MCVCVGEGVSGTLSDTGSTGSDRACISLLATLDVLLGRGGKGLCVCGGVLSIRRRKGG